MSTQSKPVSINPELTSGAKPAPVKPQNNSAAAGIKIPDFLKRG